MSDTRTLLCDTADGLFRSIAHETDFGENWTRIADAGFASLLVPEASGGFGGDWGDAFAVLRLAGQHHLALPIGEAIVATAALAMAGIDVPEGSTGLADGVTGMISGSRFSGTLHRLPWGRNLDHVVAGMEGRVVLLNCSAAAAVERGTNLAGEARDTLRFEAVAVQAVPGPDPRALGAFARVAQAAGALDAALAMAVEHVNARQQFGKPLSKLQAVQQNLAVAAVEAAAVNTAGQAAAFALDCGDAAIEIAAAKLRTNVAIGLTSGIVHQVHGAIGFTEEYPLHLLTRRLNAWRSEFGGDRHWADILGREVARAGSAGFWNELTRRSDRIANA